MNIRPRLCLASPYFRLITRCYRRLLFHRRDVSVQLLYRQSNPWDRIISKRVPELGSQFLHLFVNHPWVKDCLSQFEALRCLALVSRRVQEVESVRRECPHAQNGAGHVHHSAEVRPFRLSRPFYVELIDPLALQ